MSAVVNPPKTVRLRGYVTLEKGKPPLQRPYYGVDAEVCLTPDYLRGGDEYELIKPAKNAALAKNGETIALWDGVNAGEILKARQGALASTMCRVAMKRDIFDENYFYYALKVWEGYLKGQTSGTEIRHVDKELFENLEIAVLPKPEQTKIAEILSTVDRAIEQTEALIAKQQRLKTGLMQDLLTRGIDEHGNLRSEKTHKFKDSPLGRIPVEWEVKPLDALAEVSRGKFTHRPRNDPQFFGGEFPFIQTGDVTANIGRTLTVFSQTLNERGTKVSKGFPVGTIAITIAANIADTTLLGLPMYFPDSVVGAVVRHPHNIRFVELMIRRWKPILEQLAPQSAQRNINLETLRPLQIPTPSPDEQERIGSLYDEMDLDHVKLEKQMTKLRLLKTALMQDLLTGRKRVTELLHNREVPA